MKKYKIFWATTFFLSTFVLLLAAEVIARLSGYMPISNKTNLNEPLIHEYDGILGWKNTPGTYSYPSYSSDKKTITISILNAGQRATSNHSKSKFKSSLLTIGCSYTQGWAVSDEDTYPWFLQEKFSDVEIVNLATSGYGTYQSLLALDKHLKTQNKPKLIVYGLIQDHERRNVASQDWLRALSLYSRQQVYVPYVSLDRQFNLVAKKPRSHPKFLLRNYLALIPLLENAYSRALDWQDHSWRYKQRRFVTEKLIQEMGKLSANHQAKFYTVILEADHNAKKYYLESLAQNGINVFDCTHPESHSMVVKGETHPNKQLHNYWANCIARNLKSDAIMLPQQQ